jgi:hypothetical protein
MMMNARRRNYHAVPCASSQSRTFLAGVLNSRERGQTT